jgi:poly(A) polymerase
MKLLMALDALKTLLPPVAAYLRERDATATGAYFRFVEVMDELINGGVAFDDSMLLASILLPLALDEPEVPDGQQDTGQPVVSVAKAVESLLYELVQKARLPRRIAERCRMILMAQRTMAGLRRRRGGLGGFRGHPLFFESLKVFEVWVRATNEHREALEKWKAGAAPNPTTDAPGPRRRRRRPRRGERSEGAAEVAPSSGSTQSE